MPRTSNNISYFVSKIITVLVHFYQKKCTILLKSIFFFFEHIVKRYQCCKIQIHYHDFLWINLYKLLEANWSLHFFKIKCWDQFSLHIDLFLKIKKINCRFGQNLTISASSEQNQGFELSLPVTSHLIFFYHFFYLVKYWNETYRYQRLDHILSSSISQSSHGQSMNTVYITSRVMHMVTLFLLLVCCAWVVSTSIHFIFLSHH